MAHGRVDDQVLLKSRLALRALAEKELERGNPFPMIRYEWPELIITDPDDLEAFERHCSRRDNLDLRLDDFQVDMIRSVFDQKHTQVYMAGGTKMGKGFVTGGIIVNLWYNLHKAKIILIGPTTTHLMDNLFAETVAWRRKMTSYRDGLVVCEVQKERLQDPENKDHFVKLANTSSGESLSGSHSSATMFVFDEASSTPDDYYIQSLSQARMIVAISNPRAPSGWFFQGFPPDFETGARTIKADTGPRRVIAAGAVDCINVKAGRLDSPIAPACGITISGREFQNGDPIPRDLHARTRLLIPGQVCKRLCESLKLLADETEVLFRVYGKFPRDGSAFQVFSPSWRLACTGRQMELKQQGVILPKAVGIDPAGSSGGDYCALAFGDTQGVYDLILEKNPNLAMLKGWIYQVSNQRGIELRHGDIPVGIDNIGLGQGLADHMESEGVQILRVDSRTKPVHGSEEFDKRRDEMYGELAQALNPKFSITPWGLIDDDQLFKELYALEKIFLPDGRSWKLNLKRRPKAQRDMKLPDNRSSVEEKIGHSPDRSDAIAILYQAVKTLPEFSNLTENQFVPDRELKKFERLDKKHLRVTFWNGRTVDYEESEFLELFGQNPVCFGMMDFFESSREGICRPIDTTFCSLSSQDSWGLQLSL